MPRYVPGLGHINAGDLREQIPIFRSPMSCIRQAGLRFFVNAAKGRAKPRISFTMRPTCKNNRVPHPPTAFEPEHRG